MRYQDNLNGISPSMLQGFFVGWANKPSSEKLFASLEHSQYVIIAVESDHIIGFVNALTDSELSAYIPFLEVLPSFQNKGIGKNLLNRMLAILNQKYYMIDIVCDETLVKYYNKFGFKKHTAMIRRNYELLSNLPRK